MPDVHPTACIAPSATLDDSARIGPFCIVGADAIIGPETTLEAHVVIGPRTSLGRRNRVYPFACIGMEPQDLKYRGELTRVRVGDGNIIREYVTIHAGTARGDGTTRVGNYGMFMAGSHIGHDCVVGDHVVMTNGSALAGHVDVEEGATLGGFAGVHQFARVGALAMIAAGAMVSQDVPPFVCVQGDRARLAGLNSVGLRRAGKSSAVIMVLKRAYRVLFRSGLPRSDAIRRIRDEIELCEELIHLLTFMETSQRGVCR